MPISGTQGMMCAKYLKGSPLRETNPLLLLWKMLRSTCRAIILIFASGSLALIHCLLTSTFWWQPWDKCSWQEVCFFISEKPWLYSEIKRFFQQGAEHSQRVLYYRHPVNENQVDSCDMWEEKRWVQANRCKMVGCQALQESEIRTKSVNIFGGGLCPTCQSQLSDSGLIVHVFVHGLLVEQNKRSYIFRNFIGRGIPQAWKIFLGSQIRGNHANCVYSKRANRILMLSTPSLI